MKPPSYHDQLMRQVVTPCTRPHIIDRPLGVIALVAIAGLAAIGALHVLGAFMPP